MEISSPVSFYSVVAMIPLEKSSPTVATSTTIPYLILPEKELHGNGSDVVRRCGRDMNSSVGGNCSEEDVDGEGTDDGIRTYNWAALFLFAIVIVTIGGNVLVCLAVSYKRKLQNMFNFFLVSLALSDMLSAILVMPLSIIKAAVDPLPVPKLMCVAWYSLDVLFTSSTICHLCIISIDRYMTLTYPLKYGHAKKKKHTIMKIAVVWVISFCIAGPLFILTMLDSHEDSVVYKGCGPETPTFVISATVTSFYLPLLIMTVMYALTVRALQQQLKEQRRMTVTNSCRSTSAGGSRGDDGPSRKASAVSTTLLTSDGGGPHMQYNSCSTLKSPILLKQRSLQVNTELAHHCLDSPQHRLHTQSLRLKNKVPATASLSSATLAKDLPTSAVTPAAANADPHPPHPPPGRYLTVRDRRSTNSVLLHMQTAGRHMSTSDIAFQDSELVTGSISNLASPRSPLPAEKYRFRFNHSFTFRRSVSSTGSSRRGSSSPDKGRRAVQVLGILFAVFVICYLPFFAVYIIKGTCVVCQPYISPHALVALEWLAYSGSMLNPIIYHIFNPDFRRAFQNLLRCRCPRLLSRQRQRTDLPVCRIDAV